jgi:hypothetical protein
MNTPIWFVIVPASLPLSNFIYQSIFPVNASQVSYKMFLFIYSTFQTSFFPTILGADRQWNFILGTAMLIISSTIYFVSYIIMIAKLYLHHKKISPSGQSVTKLNTNAKREKG